MISSSCSDLIPLGKAGVSSSPSKDACKRSDGLILFSIVFNLSGDIAHSATLGGRLPEVRLWGNPWKGVLVLDSGFYGVDSGFPDSVPVELGFWIKGSRIQDSVECVPYF